MNQENVEDGMRLLSNGGRGNRLRTAAVMIQEPERMEGAGQKDASG